MGARILLAFLAKWLPGPVRHVGREWWIRRLRASSTMQLRMQCALNEELPLSIPLVSGYALVPYSPSLNEAWRQLLNESEEFDVLDAAGFQSQLIDTLLPQGAAFVFYGDALVACAAACALKEFLPAATLSYVVVSPAHRGLKLGQIVTLEVMAQAKRAGFDTMILHTDDHRVPAIKTYLKLGFLPVRDASRDAPARWEALNLARKS